MPSQAAIKIPEFAFGAKLLSLPRENRKPPPLMSIMEVFGRFGGAHLGNVTRMQRRASRLTKRQVLRIPGFKARNLVSENSLSAAKRNSFHLLSVPLRGAEKPPHFLIRHFLIRHLTPDTRHLALEP
jgi:hypothetical protein